MSKSEIDPFIKDCNCCADYFEACSLYLPAIHRRTIRELTSLFIENKDNFDKQDYKTLMEKFSKIIKGGNVYFMEEKFMNTLMEES
jgi:hypothetical protein